MIRKLFYFCIICSLWSCSGNRWIRIMQSSPVIPIPRLTFEDSLKAHVWTNYTQDGAACQNNASIFLMMRDNVMYVRFLENGVWSSVASVPYGYYSDENLIRYIVHYDTLALFANLHTSSGPKFVHGYNIIQMRKAELRKYIPPNRQRSLSYSTAALGFDRFELVNDTILFAQGNSDFMDNSATRWNLHPCDLPFPWDENLYLYGSARPYRQQIQEAKRKVQMQKRKTQ